MVDSRIDAPVLVNTVIASGLVLLISPIPFGWLTTVAGLTLLLILFAYDRERQRSMPQSLAFSSVCGLCVTLALGIFVERAVVRSDLGLWLVVTWACATVIGTATDRYRAGRPAYSASGLSLNTINSPLAASPEPEFHTAKRESQAFSAPAAPAQSAYSPAYGSVPAPTSVDMPSASETVRHPVFDPTPPVQSPQYKPEEVDIYVEVIGGGISFLRSVKAVHIARDIYRIEDVMPEQEQWRYQPGQTVRCKKRKLSSGKALVAYQEIVLQRAN
jgi:hypothetical protein